MLFHITHTRLFLTSYLTNLSVTQSILVSCGIYRDIPALYRFRYHNVQIHPYRAPPPLSTLRISITLHISYITVKFGSMKVTYGSMALSGNCTIQIWGRRRLSHGSRSIRESQIKGRSSPVSQFNFKYKYHFNVIDSNHFAC